ncbi:MAG: polymer-forming cytoskeletal protein, partial [Pseudomonadota bacterium]
SMLGKNKRKNVSIETLVGAASRVSGDLHFTGASHIDGIVNGGVIADSDESSTLSVSENGEIHGNVQVPNVVLNGLVKGDVIANERVELGPTARVIGNVYYNLIEMAIGAEINGKLVHQRDATAPEPENS